MNEITSAFLNETAAIPGPAWDRPNMSMRIRNNAAVLAMRPKAPMKRADINCALLETTARGAVASQLKRLHDASVQTIVRRSGLGLGLISPVNFRG